MICSSARDVAIARMKKYKNNHGQSNERKPQKPQRKLSARQPKPLDEACAAEAAKQSQQNDNNNNNDDDDDDKQHRSCRRRSSSFYEWRSGGEASPDWRSMSQNFSWHPDVEMIVERMDKRHAFFASTYSLRVHDHFGDRIYDDDDDEELRKEGSSSSSDSSWWASMAERMKQGLSRLRKAVVCRDAASTAVVYPSSPVLDEHDTSPFLRLAL